MQWKTPAWCADRNRNIAKITWNCFGHQNVPYLYIQEDFNYFRQIGALWTDGYYKLLNNVTVFTLLLNREKTFTNQGLSNLSAHIPSRLPPKPLTFYFYSLKKASSGKPCLDSNILESIIRNLARFVGWKTNMFSWFQNHQKSVLYAILLGTRFGKHSTKFLHSRDIEGTTKPHFSTNIYQFFVQIVLLICTSIWGLSHQWTSRHGGIFWSFHKVKMVVVRHMGHDHVHGNGFVIDAQNWKTVFEGKWWLLLY